MYIDNFQLVQYNSEPYKYMDQITNKLYNNIITYVHTHRQTNTGTHTCRHRQTDRQTDTGTHRQRQRHRLTDTDRQT